MNRRRFKLSGIRELISEINTLRFQIRSGYREASGTIQGIALKVHADILQSIRGTALDEDDTEFIRNTLRQNRGLIASLTEALNAHTDQTKLNKLKHKLDQNYCHVQLCLSGLDVSVDQPEEVSA